MGFCNASCSFTRFRIIDPIPSELLTQIPEKLRQFAFRDIDDLPEMQAYGWASCSFMLLTLLIPQVIRRSDFRDVVHFLCSKLHFHIASGRIIIKCDM